MKQQAQDDESFDGEDGKGEEIEDEDDGADKDYEQSDDEVEAGMKERAWRTLMI